MRRFSSYGPIDIDEHYYVPRNELLEIGYTQLTGENPEKGGHYFTVWAPRQTGKTWMMQELVRRLKQTDEYHVGIISMQPAKKKASEEKVLEILLDKMTQIFKIPFPKIEFISDLASLFTKQYFQKPVILILDEFDALKEDFINSFADIFRDIFISRTSEPDQKSPDKTFILHGLALIGVRSVLGIENVQGSPFNTQRTLQIPNLTLEEVRGMFQWYEKESGQAIEPSVIDQIYKEFNGQPGLTCWFGELLTEGCQWYTNDKSKPITANEFEIVRAVATYVLPNNNILNLISKAKEEANKRLILKMFQTDEKITFSFDNNAMNALYMHGLVEPETVDQKTYYMKFASPFVQKRLFNYFSGQYFNDLGKLVDPFISMSDVITDTTLNIPNILKLYQTYLKKNSVWLFKDMPRRSDMHIFEAIFHFNLYAYLSEFMKSPGGRVIPEFPTGNGKIDLILTYGTNRYGLELKSFANERNYHESLKQASKYGKRLELAEIFLVVFVESIDDTNRAKFEVEFAASEIGVKVLPIFIETGN